MELNMGSEIERASESSNLKKKLYIRVLENNLAGLRELGQKLGPIQRGTFRKRYGNVLRLLEVKVQVPVVTALAQHYDPPMRCFTFWDFQLVLTLEEYEQIFDLPLEGGVPYKHLEQNVSIPTLTGIMKLHPRELEGRLVTRRGVKGFTKSIWRHICINYLTRKIGRRSWMSSPWSFMVCWCFLTRKISWITTQLVCSLLWRPEPRILSQQYWLTPMQHLIYGVKEERGKWHAAYRLYVWLISRIGERAVGFRCPIELALKRGPEPRGGDEWKQFFVGLNETKIQWQPSWQSRSHLIYSCGKYPNVPLMGTKCCINYNPVLAQRPDIR